MVNKGPVRTAAVIEVGTNNVRMHVSQLVKGSIVKLDELEYPVNLGHDIFERGELSFDSLRELSSVLSKFSSALLSYGIDSPRVVSCTVMREAANRSLVVDQLKVRNSIQVQVLEESEEKAYLYSEIVNKLQSDTSLALRGNTLLACVGSGSIGIGVFDGKKMLYSQNISMGAIKMQDILSIVRQRESDSFLMAEEYLESMLNRIDLKEFAIENIVFSGTEMKLISELCSSGQGKSTKLTAGDDMPVRRLDCGKLSELYRTVRTLPTEGIARRYQLPEDRATIFYTALCIYQGMLRFCQKPVCTAAVNTNISEALLRHLLMPKSQPNFAAFLRESALACAQATAKKFHCNLQHAALIAGYACAIYDKMKKVHGLDPSKRLILELAALLHSSGNFISAYRHSTCTFHLIKALDLFGLKKQELTEIAFVASNVLGTGLASVFNALSDEEQITISKLSAIFQLANSLDKAHCGKLQNLKISFDEDRLLIKASADTDTLLERWSFKECASYFENIFGLSPELSVKNDMI